MGPIHNKFKEQVREYLGVRNVELFVNGHLALYTAIRALGLKGEIITTPFTFASTTNAIKQAGCEPVYCDIKDDYTIDESKIEALITEKTVAIMGVHVYGNICAVEEIQRIADKHGLKVIYDAAHAFGVKYKGVDVGSYGDVSMFSFHATKVFHTIEGGCLTFSDDALVDKIAKERNFGVAGDELVCFGTNAKMNEFQAAMGICNLRHIEDEIASRGVAFERYNERLSGVEGIKLLEISPELKQNYAYYPIYIEPSVFGMDRDAVAEKLLEKGILARKYFYPLVSENKEFECDMTMGTPKALNISRNILCLPMYAHLSTEDVDLICNVILQKQEG